MPSKNPEVLKRASKKYYEKTKNDEEKKRKAIERATKWRIENREKRKKWEEENKEKRKIALKKWKEENPERCKLHSNVRSEESLKKAIKKYKQTEKGKITRQASRDAYRKRCKDASLNRFDIKEILKIYRQCKELSKLTGQEYHVDHIIPIRHEKVCGLHVSWNLQIILKKDNLSKNNYFEG